MAVAPACHIFNINPIIEMASRKGHRKAHRKTRRHPRRRTHRGGMAPVDYVNKQPMILNLAQGNDFARYHTGQHGGMAPYPGAVNSSSLPSELAASARITSTLNAYNEIKGLQDGGRKNRKNSRKSRKNSRKSRKQYGGVLVPWGGGKRKNRRNSRRNSRRMNGGAAFNLAIDSPMQVPESYKQLIPESLRQQAGLHQEWADAANPSSMMPKA